MFDYSDLLIKHFEHPHNVGELNAANVITVEHLAPRDNLVLKLQFLMRKDAVVQNAKFKAQACPTIIALLSYLTEQIKGKPLSFIEVLDIQQMAQLFGLPPTKIGRVMIVVDLFEAARKKYGA